MLSEEDGPTDVGICDTDGCDGRRPRYLLMKRADTLRACRRCAQELTALHGWALVMIMPGVKTASSSSSRKLRSV